MRAFKSLSALRINRVLNRTGIPLWQRNDYEHIIRDDEELNAIREYITNNPVQWDENEQNPFRIRGFNPRQVDAGVRLLSQLLLKRVQHAVSIPGLL